MYHKILDFFAGKRIAILGFGMEGKSTYRFIRRYMKDISLTVIDQKNMQLENEALFSLDHSLSFVYGEHYLENLEKYDVIMKSPGISFKDIDISKIRNKIYSQIELLLMFYRDNMIGITGTKGKSTTSTLIYQVLCESGKDTRLVGNIGIPVFDEIEEYTDHTILVVEMSSHQLEYVDFSPHIGIILNLFEDHLDHAGSVEHYYASKMHMFDYQREEDISIYSRDNKNLCEYIKNGNYRSHMYPVQLEYDSNCVSLKGNEVRFQDTVLYVDDHQRHLLGTHNLENIMVVMLVAKLLNLDLDKAKKTVDSFRGLEHRLEFVGVFGDVTYYNDAIATIPEATMNGIRALKKVDTLIFGGMDRGIDYSQFITYLLHADISNLICMPTTGYKIGQLLMEEGCTKNIVFVDTLEEAVATAKKVTAKGGICLLSPAASSYEYFKNFQEKGNCYKKLVQD